MRGLREIIVEDKDQVEVGAVAHLSAAEFAEGEQAEARRQPTVDAVAQVEDGFLLGGLQTDIGEVSEPARGLARGEAP